MKCPIDNEALVMTARSGVEIDYCPKCRGVWLDRGELDKIIERGAQAAAPAPEKREHHDRDYDWDRDRDRDREHGYGQKPYYKKRESFLSDLFDF